MIDDSREFPPCRNSPARFTARSPTASGTRAGAALWWCFDIERSRAADLKDEQAIWAGMIESVTRSHLRLAECTPRKRPSSRRPCWRRPRSPSAAGSGTGATGRVWIRRCWRARRTFTPAPTGRGARGVPLLPLVPAPQKTRRTRVRGEPRRVRRRYRPPGSYRDRIGWRDHRQAPGCGQDPRPGPRLRPSRLGWPAAGPGRGIYRPLCHRHRAVAAGDVVSCVRSRSRAAARNTKRTRNRANGSVTTAKGLRLRW